MMEKKRILLIGTGGTIASEMGENGLTPELTSEQLLKYIPDISGICEISCCQLFSLTEGFARHDGGQVSLTAEQVEEIRAILDRQGAN